MITFFGMQNKQKVSVFSTIISSYVPLHPAELDTNNYISSFSEAYLFVFSMLGMII